MSDINFWKPVYQLFDPDAPLATAEELEKLYVRRANSPVEELVSSLEMEGNPAKFLLAGHRGITKRLTTLGTEYQDIFQPDALGQTAMGGGDAKLAAMMGAWLGWKSLLLAGFLACLVGALIGVGAIALGLLNRRQPMPFSPFLALGSLLTVFWGEAIVSTDLRIFFN